MTTDVPNLFVHAEGTGDVKSDRLLPPALALIDHIARETGMHLLDGRTRLDGIRRRILGGPRDVPVDADANDDASETTDLMWALQAESLSTLPD